MSCSACALKDQIIRDLQAELNAMSGTLVAHLEIYKLHIRRIADLQRELDELRGKIS